MDIAIRQPRYSPAQRAAIWPRRSRPCLSLEVFAAGFAPRVEAEPAKPKKPDGLIGVITAALKLCSLVGLPELFSPDSKAPTLLQLEETARGVVLRLIHRKHGSKAIVDGAAEALTELLTAFGRRVSFREIMHAPNMGGWMAVLRVAPSLGRNTAYAMVR